MTLSSKNLSDLRIMLSISSYERIYDQNKQCFTSKLKSGALRVHKSSDREDFIKYKKYRVSWSNWTPLKLVYQPYQWHSDRI